VASVLPVKRARRTACCACAPANWPTHLSTSAAACFCLRLTLLQILLYELGVLKRFVLRRYMMPSTFWPKLPRCFLGRTSRGTLGYAQHAVGHAAGPRPHPQLAAQCSTSSSSEGSTLSYQRQGWRGRRGSRRASAQPPQPLNPAVQQLLASRGVDTAALEASLKHRASQLTPQQVGCSPAQPSPAAGMCYRWQPPSKPLLAQPPGTTATTTPRHHCYTLCASVPPRSCTPRAQVEQAWQLLEAAGIPDPASLLLRCPALLTAEPRTNLQPKLAALGLPGPVLARLLSSYPLLVHTPVGSALLPTLYTLSE
jgi:hypothetical protein